jgi:hypothetical protein
MAQRKWKCLACDGVRVARGRNQVCATKVLVQITAADATEFWCNLTLDKAVSIGSLYVLLPQF